MGMFANVWVKVNTGYLPSYSGYEAPPGGKKSVEKFKFSSAYVQWSGDKIQIRPSAMSDAAVIIHDNRRVDVRNDRGEIKPVGELIEIKISIFK
jgi:hypothetical protein